METPEAFLERSNRVVNGVENMCDSTWSEYRSVFRKHTAAAHKSLRKLVSDLPLHTDPAKAKIGMIDFNSVKGLQRRSGFFRKARTVYDTWKKNFLRDLDITQWKGSAVERSLGLVNHRTGQFQMRIRSDVARKVAQLAGAVDKAAVDEGAKKWVALMEARSITVSTKTAGLNIRTPVSKTAPKLSTDAGGGMGSSLKLSVEDQEKAWLENVLRGADQLSRNHANELYDVATGTAMRDQLEDVMDKFAPDGDMPQKIERQQLLAVTTHIRAMMRRVATSQNFLNKMGVSYYVQVPPTRPVDFDPSQSVKRRAYTVTDSKSLASETGGMGDSLGLFPGDPVLPVPIPPGADLGAIKKAAEAARLKYLKLIGKFKDFGSPQQPI